MDKGAWTVILKASNNFTFCSVFSILAKDERSSAMNKLGMNWFTEGRVDFEYKKYVLLAYLQQVHQSFEENKLYPQLAELVSHYQNLKLFIDTKSKLYNSFPKELSEVDLKNFRLVYEKTIEDDELMGEINRIVEYSLPRLKGGLEEGRTLYDGIEAAITFAPIGILPLYKDEGYLLLKSGATSQTQVYQYQITLFSGADENYRAINTTYIGQYQYGLVYTFENIKKELIKTRKELPNPATYLAECATIVPEHETLLPIAKRLLVRRIAKEK